MANPETDFDYYDFVDSVTSMTELLNQEAEFFALMQIAKVEKMQRKKLELTDRIEAQQRFLKKHPYVYKNLTNQQIDHLRQCLTAFESALRTCEDELQKASSVNQILVKMIVDTIRDQVKTQTSYANFQKTDARSQSKHMPAVRFNEQI